MAREIDGQGENAVVLREGDREQTIIRIKGSTDGEWSAQVEEAAGAFFGADTTLPDQIPADRFRMFLVKTGQEARILNYLKTLPEPNRSIALKEFEYMLSFTPVSALGTAVKAALGYDDAKFAEAMRAAGEIQADDYGDPKPSLLASIAKFFSPS